MNKFKSYLLYSFALAIGSIMIPSCTSEAPFMPMEEGHVTFTTEMHSDVDIVTRGLDDDTKKKLEENLTIYIESGKGVIRKYTGKNNLPNNLSLTAGDYAIEGWTGDSVSASYNQKFYRGYQAFTIEPGGNTQVKFNVNIANVIVSVDAETLEQKFDDFKVSFSHSRGLLEFDRESTEQGKKGYFMMPSSDTDLYYKVELKSQLGENIVKEGTISNVQRAHEYSIKLLTQEPENTLGGGLVKIEILDIPVLDKSLNVYPAPLYYAQVGASTEEFDIVNMQIDCSEGNFSDVRLRIVGYGGLSKLSLNFPSPFAGMESINGVNLRNNGDAKNQAIESLKNLKIIYGAELEGKVFDDSGAISFQECWITFEADFLRNLPASTTEYVIEVNATDAMDIPASRSLNIRIANTEAAVDKRLVETLAPPSTYDKNKPMAILATSANLEMMVKAEEALNYGIEYKKKDSDEEYKKVMPMVQSQSLQTVSLKLEGLEPGTEYEYRAFCDGYIEQNKKSFTTEKVFPIPNSSMENWNTFNSSTTNAKDVPVPTDGTSVTFWDTGNHGSRSVALAATTLTEGSTEIFNTGTRSARLNSKFVGIGALGKLAAGNLFVGYFAGVDGTDGILQLGREYNNSHPSSLNVYVNYRPGTVQSNGTNGKFLKAGDKDVAQIYVALTDGPYEIRTKNQSKLFNEDDSQVLAYGQVTIEGDYGDDHKMALLNIPLKYKETAKYQEATHLIIVCAASKYGDYFEGGEGTLMYLDDFELEYGDIQWK